ncbi:HAD domain-containing protein [Kibdelosporangium phytohabitans]|uniref:HAD domain-containing protein n=1 Tax=Kibdelosporangium phytohabitans TaxID=860235 RepID=UPI000B0619BB
MATVASPHTQHAQNTAPKIGGYRAVVTGSRQRPLLFLDVDGPLIPFGAPSGQYSTYLSDLDSLTSSSNPLLARLYPGHGPRLATLPCDLVWATTWAAEANECLSPRLGLPQLPVVDWPETSEFEEGDERHGLHWKTRALVGWAAGRPFAWVDDEITATDREWVRAHHRAPALLHRVDARHGLVDADYTALAEWLRKA